VNVPDFKGRGESEPAPYYYQNLGEAEYLVALYSMMRLLGYPASKISILTTYNGQKDLIRDVVEARCAQHPLIGRPHKVRGSPGPLTATLNKGITETHVVTLWHAHTHTHTHTHSLSLTLTLTLTLSHTNTLTSVTCTHAATICEPCSVWTGTPLVLSGVAVKEIDRVGGCILLDCVWDAVAAAAAAGVILRQQHDGVSVP
jgi:hypothetical protein